MRDWYAVSSIGEKWGGNERAAVRTQPKMRGGKSARDISAWREPETAIWKRLELFLSAGEVELG